MRFFFTALLSLLSSFLLTSAAAWSHTPLPADTIAARMSIKLTGRMPTAAELAAFRNALNDRPGEIQAVVGDMAEYYFRQPEFSRSVERFHAVWFRIPEGETSKISGYIVGNDRPYFELFDKDYLFASGAMRERYAATGALFSGQFPASGSEWREVRLGNGETRFRSILSNLDLLNRYPDTPTNSNRSRANFIFRSFFCETLSPSEPTPAFLHSSLTDDDHANNPDCVGCHYRLDPMARFFDKWRPAAAGTTWYDAGQSAQGTVVIPVAGEPARRIPGTSESDLAKILAAQPKVHQCISSKAWTYVFGTSVLIPADYESTLLQSFQERSSFRSAIKTAILHPYFWSSTTPPPLDYPAIAPILQSCGDCHAGSSSTAFDPGSYPFSPDHGQNVDLLTSIYGAINHRAGFLPMPRAPRPKLPPEELDKVREWILNGAIDAGGQSTLNAEEIERVLDE